MFNLEEYLNDLDISVNVDESLKKYSTMKVGGNCKYFVMPDNIDKLITVITICKMYSIEYFVIGNGSNIIFTDKGYDGVIICTKNIKGISLNSGLLNVKCGTMVREVASYCLKNELKGFENLSGIPATIGGACFMNAGAYGSEIKDVLASCKVLDEEGNVFTITRKNIDLKYRHSSFMDQKLIILEANFILKTGKYEEIEEVIKTNDRLRKEKQPISEKSVGSTFKRPKEENMYASKLIDDCGLKGFSIGGAKVSEKHAGFVINSDNATFDDIIELTEHIRKTVFDKFSVMLELEAIVVGEV